MKKYFALILLFSVINLYAQEKTENQGQSIELPDFVITGVQSVDIPIQKKPRPDLVPTLSKDFFTPAYAPEEFELSDFSKPIRKDVEFYKSKNANNGMFYVGAGINTLPTGEFYFNTGSENVLFAVNLWGSNIKDYDPYSDYNVSGASLNTDFFVSTNSDFMPGLKISVNAKYIRDAYKFYKSFVPSDERERQNAVVSVAFKNTLNRTINYGLDFSGSLFKLSDIGLQENLITGKGFLELNMGKLAVGGNALFQTQSLKDYFPDTKNNFISTNAYLKIKSTNSLQAKLGIAYSKQDSNSFFAPTASISAKLGDNLSFFGEYTPNAEFNTITGLTQKNRFYRVGLTQNVFTENKSNFKAMFKYQYEKYFEIALGGGYTKTDNFVYFEEIILPGNFNLQTANDVKRVYGFADFLFHLGPLGEFYSSSVYQSVKNSADNYVPYNPQFTTDLVYTYNFANNFYLQAGVQFAFDYFSDSANLNKINNYNNLFSSLGYSITDNLLLKVTVENILNNENYKFNNYKEKPFDVIAGVEYRW